MVTMEIEFTNTIWHWRGPSPYYFVTVPPAEADALHAIAASVTYGWGMIPANVQIGETRWYTALWPKDGGYIVPLKDAVRRAGVDFAQGWLYGAAADTPSFTNPAPALAAPAARRRGAVDSWG